MTTIPLNCEGFAEVLADYLERDDSPRMRTAVETHAESCAACGSLLADLQQIRVDAGGLPTLTPSRDLWTGIAERIAAPVVAISSGRGARDAGRGTAGARSDPPAVGGYPRGAWEDRRAWLRPAAAAAALVVLTAGVTYFATREALQQDQQVAAGPVDSTTMDPRKMVADANDSARRAEGTRTRFVATRNDDGLADRAPRPAPRTPVSLVSDPGPAAALDAVYGREIARLRRIIEERRGQLDTATVHIIERNLAIIDHAIGESRAALARDPASALLNDQLNNALEQKIELLRAAALLPARS